MALRNGGYNVLAAVLFTIIAQAASRRHFACYFSNWAGYREGNGKFEPENIDPNECTHLMYGYGIINTAVSISDSIFLAVLLPVLEILEATVVKSYFPASVSSSRELESRIAITLSLAMTNINKKKTLRPAAGFQVIYQKK
jgi:GH18 family chitinase